jgi:hypothetical protein
MSNQKGAGNPTPFIRGPRKDTQPYHPDAPKRGASFASGNQGKQMQSDQNVAVGRSRVKSSNTSRSEPSSNAANAQLFAQIKWGVKEVASEEIVTMTTIPVHHRAMVRRVPTTSRCIQRPRSAT